jgi:hypothetical protein
MTAASCTSSCLPPLDRPKAVAGRQFSITDWSNNSEKNTSYAAYAQATYSIGPIPVSPPACVIPMTSARAISASQSIRTPRTQATTNALTNAVFNPSPFVYNGISYAGQSNVCLLTNPNGVTLPLSQCAVDINKSYHKPTWTLALDHDLWEGTMVYATMRSGYRSGRHQYPGAEYRRP